MGFSRALTSATIATFVGMLSVGPRVAAAESVTSSRSFVVDLHRGDSGSVRMIDLVATTDTAHPGAPLKVELRVSHVGKAPDQVIPFTVDASAEAVLASADDVDLNFDGYRDFWVLREMGAKWGRYEAFVFDAKKGQFVRDGFSREVSQLDNPEVDEVSKTITSGSIGPSEPYRTVHKVVQGRMLVTESCVFHNGKDPGASDKNQGLLILQKIVSGALRIVSQKQIAVGWDENPCSSSAGP